MKRTILLLFFLLFVATLAACSAPAPTSAPLASPTASSTDTPPTPSATSPSLVSVSSGGAQQPTSAPASTASPSLAPPSVAQPTTAPPSSAPSSATPSLAPTDAAPPAAQPANPPAATPETATAAGACEEKPAYYGDVTIPDDTFFEQGVSFTKTWRFRNDGTCTWTPAYKLIFYSGDIMSGPLSQPFPSDVPPGEQVELSVDLLSPTRGGTHIGHWWFEDPNGTRFGTGSARADTFWVKIAVRFLDQNDQPQGDPAEQPPPTPPAGCVAQRDPAVEAQVLELINQNRSANSLPPLAANAALEEAAFVHSRDMACNGFVDHNGSDGSSWYDRISAQGYVYSNANENIYVGFPDFGGTAAGAVDWWMNSQVHRDNILNAGNSEAGVGYVYDQNSEWGGYYTVVFARP